MSVKLSFKAVYFNENIPVLRLREFRDLIQSFKSIQKFMSGLMQKKNQFKSKRLRLLLTIAQKKAEAARPCKDEVKQEGQTDIV